MNKKGFTLVEVIVAVAILGVITALAFSGVTGLVDNNSKRKFEEYGQSLIYIAKVYVDSYKEDMFYDGTETECHRLSLDYLIGHNKVDDFTQKDISCNNADSAIYIRRMNNGGSDYYVYSVSLRCEDTSKTPPTELFNNLTTPVQEDALKQFDPSASCASTANN